MPCPEAPCEKPLLAGLGPMLGAQEHWPLLTSLPAQSCQSCLTLCDLKDSSPLGSSVRGFSRQGY